MSEISIQNLDKIRSSECIVPFPSVTPSLSRAQILKGVMPIGGKKWQGNNGDVPVE